MCPRRLIRRRSSNLENVAGEFPPVSRHNHDLCKLLVVAFVAVLCGATSCAEMADFGRSKEHVFRGLLKLKHAIPSHDTDPTVFRVIDPKALDAAFGRVLAQIAALLGDGDVIAIPSWGLKANPRRATDGKALRGARDKGQSARTRRMVSALSRPPAPDPGHAYRAFMKALPASGVPPEMAENWRRRLKCWA